GFRPLPGGQGGGGAGFQPDGMRRVVIVGGGIGGLTTALHLKDGASLVPGGLDVLVLEASSRPGGNIQTDRIDGFTIERGPNGYLDNVPTTPALVRRLGLQGEVQRADGSAGKRFLYRSGKLHLLPSGPVGFLKSPVLSLRGRLRVLGEPFARGKPEGVDESIFDFASRRIGREAASVLIDAMVSGVFAGNVHELSLASSFPKMAAMEAEHGGLVKAMLGRMKGRRVARREVEERRRRGEDVEDLVQPGGPAGPGGTLTSFRQGLDTLPIAAARELGDSVRYGVEVVSVGRGLEEGLEDGLEGTGGSSDPGLSMAPWVVRAAAGEAVSADAVVIAVPAPRAGPLLKDLDERLSRTVGQIRTAGLAVVALAFDAVAMGGAPEGFGFLVPRGTGPRILGCLWDSSIFPGRAPEGKVLLRAMVGGAHDPEAVVEGEGALVSEIRSDLRDTMGLEAPPLFARVYRWPLGIGQYTVGHGDRMARIQDRLNDLPKLWVAGSSFHGISMNSCIEKAGEQAEEILSSLQTGH
ncbi:MAG: protoporphyrinogen oxidase, partial [Gemmatimonadota bacterium]